ncbi:MAG: DsbA family protein [Acidobacteria bacterium]|nr:DsbA family protein [Acidobacteriota bacterium]
MALLMTALLTLLVPASASAQAKFIGIDDDPQLGKPDAKVTIIEFGDFQCPFCRAFWRETLPRTKKEYVDTGRVRIVFRDFAQDVHPEAMMTAMAAECADDQGKYWEFHDKAFREQDRRGRDVVRYRVADVKRWAAEIGLEPAAFNECLDSERYKAEVQKDYKDGADIGMNGTPVFFINGRALVGAHPFSSFQQIIEDELRK